MAPKNQSKRGASDDLDYQPLDSQRGASTRPAKRQRRLPSHQSAAEPIARRTRAGRVPVASTSTAQPFNLPEETSTEWSEVPQLTIGTTSDEEVPETPPLSPVRLPRSRQKLATPVVDYDEDLSELDEGDAPSGDEYQDAREEGDESQPSADEPEGSADDAEAIDDKFQGPASKHDDIVVPEDDVENVPLKASEEKSAEILRKVAAPHLKAIQAMVSLDRDCEMIYYVMDYDRNGGSVKTNIDGYERRVITFWSPMVQLQKAYRHVLLDRVCQEVHLTRRSERLRRIGYVHETLKKHLHKDLTNMSVTLDVDRSDLGIVPDEVSVFFGQAFTWTTALGQKRQGSDHEATLIPEMSQIQGIECDPSPDYVVLTDSVVMSKMFGDSHFPQKYASELGCGLVGGLRGNSTYNERCWAHALSQKYPNAIFAMISDWDPYSFDNYLTLRRGAPAFAPENPHLAIPRLIHIGPTYEDLNSNGAILPLDKEDGKTRVKNLLGHTHLPSELKPEVQKMHDQTIRAQADKCRNPIKYAAARLLELRESNTLWPKSGNLGVLHIPVPNHDEDFELDLGAAVPADVVFGQDDESGMMILMANADDRRTILERCGEEFTISKYDADGELTGQIVSTLKLAQQLVGAEREKTVAQRLKVGEEILMDYDATKDRASESFKILRDRAAYFQQLIPPPPGRVVRPLRPGNVWKNGEPGPEFRALGRAALYDAFFFRDIPLKKMKTKLASTRPGRRKAAPPADPVPPPSNVPIKSIFSFKCARCPKEFPDKVAYQEHLKSSVTYLEPAPDPVPRPLTPLDEAGYEPAESTSSLECTVCEETFDSPEARDSHLRTKEGWECVLGLANPRKMNSNTVLYACCMCRGDYDCDGVPGLERHWKMFHSDESKSKYECEDCLRDYKGKVAYHAHISDEVCGETRPNCFFPGCTHKFPNSDAAWLKKYGVDHYRVHTGAITTACPACHKDYRVLEKLEHHLTINKKSRADCGEQAWASCERAYRFPIFSVYLEAARWPWARPGATDTADTDIYSVVETSPLKIKEQRDSACVQAGAIFVDFEMEKYLETTLKSAALDPEDVEFYTSTGVKDFECFAKRAFRSKSTEYAVLVADSRFSKPAIQTRRGRMMVPGTTIQKFFDTCVDQIKQSVDRQVEGLNVPHLLLVGGLGDNGYVRNEFKKHYEPRGTKMILSNELSSKAVAEGAVIWNASCSVISRAPRYSFGIEQRLLYRPLVDDPAGRKPYTTLAGDLRVSGGWSEIVHKGRSIDAGTVYRQKYHYLYSTPTPRSNTFKVQLLSYSGDDKPEWAKDPRAKKLEGFRDVCTLTADLQDAHGAMVTLTRRSGPKGVKGSTYWGLNFSVCIRFSGTELESFLEWKENGVVKTGPVTIVLPEEASLD
ncbi:unnamed protein product [Rhizoctonia solani]|uniref:C2H2-type domain-containing protein n=1 Tax=Rhizoctonia solani TaxID=456999 RepID=A0A8H2WHD6_9AGAM|nr:unnamed protein product [Rhizoctonia solani]